MRLVDTKFEVKRCIHCLHFEETCPFFRDINYSDPTTANCCRYFKQLDENTSIVEDEALYNEKLQFSLTGSKFIHDTYPNEPDFPLWMRISNLYWYKGLDVSTGKEFGCWIMNRSNKLLSVPGDKTDTPRGWASNVYKSPIPLHNHNAAANLLSVVCWYVDSDGYAQYGVIVGNDIGYLTHPRPKLWKPIKI
ncbi:hypothetical protein ACWGKR_29740 [Bacillus thuringiensis]|uniref:hypothetical protein n=1 Tax=Bacillus thuringiensis TaxID=1428 RepID=UPI0035D589BC